MSYYLYVICDMHLLTRDCFPALPFNSGINCWYVNKSSCAYLPLNRYKGTKLGLMWECHEKRPLGKAQKRRVSGRYNHFEMNAAVPLAIAGLTRAREVMRGERQWHAAQCR